jgi:hypothetical protein
MPRIIPLLLLFAFSSVVSGAEYSVGGLDLPMIDASGRVVRRLRAVSGSGSYDVPRLQTGTVKFFDPTGKNPGEIGTLSFADATFHRATNVIESDGPMKLDFEKGTITAIGFRYDLSAGRLVLKSAVALDLAEAQVNAREGEVILTENKADGDILVSSATLRGDVTITEIKVKGIQFDRIETTSAVYTGSDDILRPAAPMITWTKGSLGGKIEIPIVKRPRGASPDATPPLAPMNQAAPTSKAP